MKKDNSRSRAFEKKLDDFLHTIGDNLHSLRMIRKATLTTVAKQIKISPGKLSKIEKGLCPHCKFGTLVMLCKHYKIKLTDVATKGKFKVRKDIAITKKKARHKSQTRMLDKKINLDPYAFITGLPGRHETKAAT